MTSFFDNDTFTSSQLVQNINIRNVDEGFHRWWNEFLNVKVTSKNGTKEKVPVVFVAPERWEIARREGLRDKNGTLILPIIAISRTGMSISNDLPTSRHFADTKEQVVYRKQINAKTSLIQEEVRNQRENADPHVSIDSKAPIYEIYTRKAPDHYSITYEVKIWTPYIENMNEIIQKTAQKFDFLSVKSFKFDVVDKYYLVAFQEDEISDDSNQDDYSGDERIIQKTMTFNVGADLHPENDDQKPNFRKYYSQSKLFFKTKVVNQIPIIDPKDLAAQSNTVLSNPPPPVISGSPQIGNTLTISGVGPFYRMLGGVRQGDTISTGYAFIAEDIGPQFSVSNAGGESNRIRFSAWSQLSTPPDALYDRQGLTLISTTHVSSQTDSSGNGHTAMTQATDTNRPFYGAIAEDSTPGYINGIFGIDYLTGPGSNLRGPTVATLLADATKIWILVAIRNATAAASLPVATSTSIYNGQCPIGSVGNHLRLSYYQVGGAGRLGFWGTGGTLQAAEVAITTQTPHLIRARKNGTTVGLIVDGAAESTAVADASISPTSEVVAFGYNGTSTFAGVMGDVLIWNTPPSANIQATAAAYFSYLYSTSESSWS